MTKDQIEQIVAELAKVKAERDAALAKVPVPGALKIAVGEGGTLVLSAAGMGTLYPDRVTAARIFEPTTAAQILAFTEAHAAEMDAKRAARLVSPEFLARQVCHRLAPT